MVKTKEISISEIGNIFTGNTPPRKNPEYYGNHTLFIKPTDISKETKYTYTPEECYSKLAYEKYKNSLVPKGATCVVTIGSIGEKLTKAHKECFINQAMNAVVPNENFDEDYVYYLLKFNLRQLKMFDSGTASGRENVSKSAFSNIRVIALTSKDEQIKVGKLLSNYDDLIENNNRRIKILEEMAQKIYKEWFVDFKFPGHETTTFKDSPLGKIPNDWEVKLFSDYFDIQNGFAFKSKDYSNNGVKIIRTKDFASTKYINITDPIFLPNQLKSKYETYMLQEYDFLLIMVGASIGKYGIVLKKDMPSLQNQNMWALRPKNNYIYLKNYSIFMFENLIKKVLSFATGAAREFFRKEHFNNQRIIVPNSCVLNLFNQITNDILNEISNLYTKNENLKQTRDILLPRLISGEIDVENMEVL